ncbi:transposable element Tcb2 transposase [Trichonephila clavipes]|nr:transposable element Tcb2 transposase [Trichonephila clavipes]
MITNFFIPELNNHDVQELWFQQDGATCHTARATIDLLKYTFGDRLISRFGPVNWPPRSCKYRKTGVYTCEYRYDKIVQMAKNTGIWGVSRYTGIVIPSAALDAHPSTLPFGVVPLTRNWTAAEWNHDVFSDESRFNLSSDDNRVRVWRLLGERLNPAFALQRYTAPTADVMV